jgi:hypothetical protein
MAYAYRQPGVVLDTDELLGRLKARGVRNIEIARVLDLPDSRIPEIRDKRRALKLDEAVKLVRAFALESSQEADPLPTPILRLLVRYIGERLGARAENGRLSELTEDVRAFAEFVADPKVRSNLVAAEAFFQAMRLRRPASEEAAPPQSDPAHGR